MDDDRKKKKKKKRSYSSSSSSDSSASEERQVTNPKLLAKLAERGETLEERQQRRAQQRAATISAQLGYTAESNPFHDPNLHEAFVWKKRDDSNNDKHPKPKKNTLHEIDKLRQRRQERDAQFAELQRIKAEENRMRELEHYDDWARKEEEFHLQQQRQRSAIRLVEGREQPIDVLAKNLLLFGLSEGTAIVKYQERYNALNALDHLEAELEEPYKLLKHLKLDELEQLLSDIQDFLRLEKEASSSLTGADTANETVIRYWEDLKTVTQDEIQYLKSGGEGGSHATTAAQVGEIFQGQSQAALVQMRRDVDDKLRKGRHMNATGGGTFDQSYWELVAEQLDVHLAKLELADLHSKMLVRQLERLEKKRNDMASMPEEDRKPAPRPDPSVSSTGADDGSDLPMGDLEEELGLADEVASGAVTYSWQDKYRPRKPRFFNRVKTGYDWNKYNQTHYDKDNPPPKVVQGYKFNIFYPDLIDPTKTPKFVLESTDSDEYCIIRFHAGPPYEDVAFKIINREWNKSRRAGFKSTFERGVLSLYFNFTTHWYRR